jgi:sialate O-acetylesterase
MKFFLILTTAFGLMINCLFAQAIKVACIGNSVTAGYLLDKPDKESYPAQLQNLLGNNYRVGNFGHSGATLLKKGHRPYFKTDEFTKVLDFHADIAVISLGLNDTDPRNWPNYKDDFQADYQYLCKLSPIFSGHPRFKSGTREWYWQIQAKIIQVSKTNQLQLIDLNKQLSTRPDLFQDNLHPDVEGASIIAKTVYENLTGNYGGLCINPIFNDHMVLQRDRPIPVYGTANANQQIEVTFNNQVKRIRTDLTGKWKIMFPAMKFGGPYKMMITAGKQVVSLDDVLIGDVWLCSGQSNMAFPLKSSKDGPDVIKHLNTKQPIRLLKYNLLAETDDRSWSKGTLDSINALDYFSGSWARLDIRTVENFSAIAFHFGETLVKNEHIPIGLIQMAVGGSTLESWMDRYTLEHDNLLVDLVDNWRKSDFIQEWARSRADVNLKNAGNIRQRHPYQPAYNFEAGILKLITSPIKGVIWYQGESNTHNAELFSHEFPLLVKSWREQWGYNFPFYYVQLSSIDRPSWPYFRDAQRKLQLVIPNSGMAVSSDLGDSLNVHPLLKREVGKRLALIALRHTYHRNIQSSGPVAVKAVLRQGSIIITFTNARKLGLKDGSTSRGFEVEDEKGYRFPVKATVAKTKVILTGLRNSRITRVLYAWQSFTRANLINEVKLPASTFSISISK